MSIINPRSSSNTPRLSNTADNPRGSRPLASRVKCMYSILGNTLSLDLCSTIGRKGSSRSSSIPRTFWSMLAEYTAGSFFAGFALAVFVSHLFPRIRLCNVFNAIHTYSPPRILHEARYQGQGQGDEVESFHGECCISEVSWNVA